MCKNLYLKNISSYPRLVGTEVEGYPLLTHKKKGDLGELIVGTKMKEFGYSVTPSDIYNGTWDKRIDGVETEIKLSVGAKRMILLLSIMSREILNGKDLYSMVTT